MRAGPAYASGALHTWFHSVTRPLVLTPKIGAFAVSINLAKSSAAPRARSSARFKSVVSFPTKIAPTMFPAASRRVDALSKICAQQHPRVFCTRVLKVMRPT